MAISAVESSLAVSPEITSKTPSQSPSLPRHWHSQSSWIETRVIQGAEYRDASRQVNGSNCYTAVALRRHRHVPSPRTRDKGDRCCEMRRIGVHVTAEMVSLPHIQPTDAAVPAMQCAAGNIYVYVRGLSDELSGSSHTAWWWCPVLGIYDI